MCEVANQGCKKDVNVHYIYIYFKAHVTVYLILIQTLTYLLKGCKFEILVSNNPVQFMSCFTTHELFWSIIERPHQPTTFLTFSMLNTLTPSQWQNMLIVMAISASHTSSTRGGVESHKCSTQKGLLKIWLYKYYNIVNKTADKGKLLPLLTLSMTTQAKVNTFKH